MPQTPAQTPPRVTPDWEALDWSKQDTTLALEVGCSREWVRQKRVALKKPKAPAHRKPTRLSAQEQRFWAWLATTTPGQHTVRDAARAADASITTISKIARNNNLVFKARHTKKYDWDSVDWASTSNTDVAVLLGCPYQTAAAYRHDHGKAPSPNHSTQEQAKAKAIRAAQTMRNLPKRFTRADYKRITGMSLSQHTVRMLLKHKLVTRTRNLSVPGSPYVYTLVNQPVRKAVKPVKRALSPGVEQRA